MGKYMRKNKTAGEVAVMDVTQSSLGVRTRAKTLALQRLKKSAAASPAAAASGLSYLQLRSRRLEKSPIIVPGHESKRQSKAIKENGVRKSSNPSPRVSSRLRMASGSIGSVAIQKDARKLIDDVEVQENCAEKNDFNVDLRVEASCGENVFELEVRERSTRESTPCSLIRDPEAIRTPGSTTRHSSIPETNRRIQNSMHRHIPTAHEMDEFFCDAEEVQQKEFIEKYNFDPVTDKPLPGRYEWQKLDP